MKALENPTSVVIWVKDCMSSMTCLCRNRMIIFQKFGLGLVSVSLSRRIEIVNWRNESFNPCKKIASKVEHNELVGSQRSNGSVMRKNILSLQEL